MGDEPATVQLADGSAVAVAKSFDPALHRRIGRFELIREIAKGGMGRVFLGRDTKLGRKVAIKFLLRDDSHFVERFLIEARATARCTHENIVTIFEVGEHERLPYMVLEYLEGKTLDQWLQANLPQRQFLEIMVSVVRALERAHEHGIVHRDLKPSNIFVTDRGQVKVLDFGIARILDVGEHEVDDSQVGTLPYMSPEQWGAGEVNAQTDIWAIGILFWRALTGVHPAGTSAVEKLRLKLRDLATALPSIAMRDPAIPRELVAIVDRCLAKKQAQRYPNATELLRDLLAFLEPREVRTEEESPYLGLNAFGETDARYFFGRASEVRSAVTQLASWPLLGVIGPSGVGKSSFIHAGVIPGLRALGGNWHVHAMRPGRVPLHRLALAIEDLLATGEQSSELTDRLQGAPGLAGVMLRDSASRRETNVVLVIDQFEELFTLCDSEEQRRAFLTALLAAADDPSSPVRVVMSMRADFLDRLAAYQDAFTELSRGLFFLVAPDLENMREILERPAQLAGYTFEPGIVDDMLQAATSRGALPLLSFAASRLWETRDHERKLLTRAGYEQMGGIGGAFARHADQVAAAVPAQNRPLLRSIMTRLVTPEGTRAVVDHVELLSLAGDARLVEQILDQLVRARLVHLHTDAEQGATVEIVHEMLINEWPMFRRWLDDSHASRAFAHELAQASRQWQAKGRPADMVWRGATAQEALAQVRRQVLQLSATEKAFVTAMERLLSRGRRRTMAAVVAIMVTLLLGLGGAMFAYVRIDMENERTLRTKAELQEKVDALEAEKKARAAAERATVDETAKREQLQTEYTASQQLSREQLEQMVVEANTARQRAEDATRRSEADRKALKDLNQQLAKAIDALNKRHVEDQAKLSELQSAIKKAGVATRILPEAK